MTCTTTQTPPVIFQGEDRTLTFTVLDTETGVVFNLTGSTTTCTIKGTSGNVVFSGAEINLIDPTKGKFQLIMSDTKTALLALGTRNIIISITIGADTRLIDVTASIIVKSATAA
jgi:hypothetical protein